MLKIIFTNKLKPQMELFLFTLLLSNKIVFILPNNPPASQR
ncbi:hypothetical protein JOC54_000976 [Alkalihalobacillus xiaoxiensis]|uniref:Uncharacterized protein n=1 Tax=Shouchella xiaoxiensis TaxID=766895 RepID=A0ABS2SQG4_9BACI|nr:hypothetical protein [Shouchella xiaoxiensis]